MSKERNEEICRLYVGGLTLRECGQHFKLSHQRVRQILRRAGVFKRDQLVERSDRDEFLGVNLTEADKIALRAEAERRGVSMSALTSDLIRDMLSTLEAQ